LQPIEHIKSQTLCYAYLGVGGTGAAPTGYAPAGLILPI